MELARFDEAEGIIFLGTGAGTSGDGGSGTEVVRNGILHSLDWNKTNAGMGMARN